MLRISDTENYWKLANTKDSITLTKWKNLTTMIKTDIESIVEKKKYTNTKSELENKNGTGYDPLITRTSYIFRYMFEHVWII